MIYYGKMHDYMSKNKDYTTIWDKYMLFILLIIIHTFMFYS